MTYAVRNRVLPAAVYDALEAKANAVGGVGEQEMFRDGQPWCILGIAGALWGVDEADVPAAVAANAPSLAERLYCAVPRPLADALGMSDEQRRYPKPVYLASDLEVQSLVGYNGRAPWSAYAAAMRWTRGPEEVTP